MEITYIQTTESNLSNVPIIDGQSVYVSDSDKQYSDFNGVRKRNVFGDEIDALIGKIEAGSIYHSSTSAIWNSGDTITILLPDKARRGMLVSIVGNYPSNVSSLYYVGGGSQGYRVGALSENGTTLTYDGTNNVLIATKTSANADAVDVAVISISGIAG